MIGLLKALGIVKGVIAVTALTAVTAFAAQTVLPAASNVGQTHAAAAAANAHSPAPGAAAPAAAPVDNEHAADVAAQLKANQARIIDNLTQLLDRMTLAGRNPKAIAAIQKILDRMKNGDTGLNRAIEATGSSGAAKPATPPGAANHSANHPPAVDHPSATDHPNATDHPGKP